MRKKVLFVFFILFSLSPALQSAEDPEQKLKDLESQIKKKPTDPMLHYRKAQALMELKKYDEGYKTAQVAMKRFMVKKSNLAWMLLEKIDLGNVRVDVHFNMGKKEQRPPKIGIGIPLSFRVWTKGKKPKLLETINFEIGYMNGKPMTAALGQMQGRAHVNFGIIDTQAKYEGIRKEAIELIKRRHPKSGGKKHD